MQHLLTIGEVAERTGLAASALRYYEAEGLIASERTSGNQRRYHRDVLRRVSFVKVAQRVGLSLDDVRAALATLPDDRTPTKADWARLSASWKRRLDDQVHLLTRLRDNLDECIGCGCLSLQSCRLFNPGDLAAADGDGARYLIQGLPAGPRAR